ncbi:MAG TPA: hypothetical protein VNG69_10375 [Casimicrobiaceae bacterium]|nr:hypothetical protein [Casimicrobiaceae bacterium]
MSARRMHDATPTAGGRCVCIVVIAWLIDRLREWRVVKRGEC